MEDVAGNDQREKEIMNKISGNMGKYYYYTCK